MYLLVAIPNDHASNEPLASIPPATLQQGISSSLRVQKILTIVTRAHLFH
jgi:hypothetical protein